MKKYFFLSKVPNLPHFLAGETLFQKSMGIALGWMSLKYDMKKLIRLLKNFWRKDKKKALLLSVSFSLNLRIIEIPELLDDTVCVEAKRRKSLNRLENCKINM